MSVRERQSEQVCVCMYDYHIAASIKTLAPLQVCVRACA